VRERVWWPRGSASVYERDAYNLVAIDIFVTGFYPRLYFEPTMQ
jgi:hypothetical protein